MFPPRLGLALHVYFGFGTEQFPNHQKQTAHSWRSVPFNGKEGDNLLLTCPVNFGPIEA